MESKKQKDQKIANSSKNELKVLWGILALVCIFFGYFTGYTYAKAHSSEQNTINTITYTPLNVITKDLSMFETVERTENWKVIYHKETKVMYIIMIDRGEMEVMVNADGTPQLYLQE